MDGKKTPETKANDKEDYVIDYYPVPPSAPAAPAPKKTSLAEKYLAEKAANQSCHGR